VWLDVRWLRFPEKTRGAPRTIPRSVSNRGKAATALRLALLWIAFLVPGVSAQKSTDGSFHKEPYYTDIQSLQQQLVQGSLTVQQLVTQLKSVRCERKI